jgi:hypothetical protein
VAPSKLVCWHLQLWLGPGHIDLRFMPFKLPR